MNKILLDVHPDFIDLDAVEHTADVASKTQSAIEVLHVIEDYPQDLHEWWNVRYPLRLYEEIVNQRQEFMDSIVARIKRAGVQNVTKKLRWGLELREVTREVEENNYKLVVTMARPDGTLLKRARGCACVRELCRNCPSLIWVTRNSHRLPTRRILVALSGENGVVRADSFNEKILRTASWIAEADKSKLHVVHALSEPEIKVVGARRSTVDVGELLNELRSEISQTCNRLLGESGSFLTEDRIHIQIGSVGVVVPQLVHQEPMDLIVIGTKSRAGLQGLLKGNSAERIMDQVGCSMLTIKPDDFVSPLLSDGGALNMPSLKAA
jgi:nucleotide-binding universal stress UspA family protein